MLQHHEDNEAKVFMANALPDANPPPLSTLGTGWGVPEGKSSGGVRDLSLT